MQGIRTKRECSGCGDTNPNYPNRANLGEEMGLLKNDCWDRIKIREKTFFTREEPTLNQVLFGPEGLKSKYTPVLLSYWTRESLETFLVPVTQDVLEKLKKVNGIDENGPGWEPLSEIFTFIANKISTTYVETGTPDHDPQGEWRERFLVDMEDEDGRPLPPVTLPPGTVMIVTGFILP
jgi:hypothetical protein